MEGQVADNQLIDEMLSSLLSDGNKDQTDSSSSPSINASDLDSFVKEILEGNVSIAQDECSEHSTSLGTTQVNQPNVMVRTPVNQVQPTQVSNTVATGAFLSSGANNAYTMVTPTASAITASFMMNGQKFINFFPVSDTGTVPVVVPPTADAGPSGLATQTKKRKLYEESEFADPAMEKKRRNAINAKNHRNRTKSKIEELTSEVKGVEKERDELKEYNVRLVAENKEMKEKLDCLSLANSKLLAENEEMKRQLNDLVAFSHERNAFAREIAILKEENTRLKQQCEEAIQRDKIGVMDFFDLINDDVHGSF